MLNVDTFVEEATIEFWFKLRNDVSNMQKFVSVEMNEKFLILSINESKLIC